MRSIALLGALGLGLLLGAVLVHEPPQVEIQNRSGVPVAEFRLAVGPDPAAGGSLAPGDVDRQGVPARREGPLRLALRFADGRTADFDVGWFSPGQSGLTRLAIVSPDSVRVVTR